MFKSILCFVWYVCAGLFPFVILTDIHVYLCVNESEPSVMQIHFRSISFRTFVTCCYLEYSSKIVYAVCSLDFVFKINKFDHQLQC